MFSKENSRLISFNKKLVNLKVKRSSVIVAVLTSSVLISAGASASIVPSWYFDRPTGYVSPNDTITLSAVLSNGRNATQTLTNKNITGAYESFGTFDSWPSNEYIFRFSDTILELPELHIPPGSSVSFDFGTYTPRFGNVPKGTYSNYESAIFFNLFYPITGNEVGIFSGTKISRTVVDPNRRGTTLSKSPEMVKVTGKFAVESVGSIAAVAVIGVLCKKTLGLGCVIGKPVIEAMHWPSLFAHGILLGKIYNDPPDPKYFEIFKPVDYIIPMPFADVFAGTDFEGLIANVMAKAGQQYSLMEAWLVSLERYGAAIESGDDVAAAMQLEALERYILLTSAAVSSTKIAIEEVYNKLEVILQSEIGTVFISREDLENTKSLFRTEGFSPEALAVLEQFGFTDDEIEQWRRIVEEADFSEVPEDIPEDIFVALRRMEGYEQLLEMTKCVGNNCVLKHERVSIPTEPFILNFDYEFFSDVGILDVYLDEFLISTIHPDSELLGIKQSARLLLSPETINHTDSNLSFLVRDVIGSQFSVDNVSISLESHSAVSEPASLPLLLIGLGGMMVFAWRNRRQSIGPIKK